MHSLFRNTYVTVITLSLSILLAACGDDGDTIIDVGSNLGTVVPLYPANGANWNDYIKDDGTDTACDPAVDTACIHGGQMMSMAVPGYSSCDGLTADERFDVFNWTCDNSVDPVRFVSTDFNDGKGLSDLVDFDAVAFLDNYLLVRESGSIVVASDPAVWWANSLVVNNDGSAMAEGEIHLVTQNASNTYTIGADKISLLIKPGVTLTGDDAMGNETVVFADSRSFVWLEGSVDATNDDYAIHLNGTSFSSLHRIIASKALVSGVYLNSSSNNSLSNITASGNTRDGVYLNSSSNNSLSNITTSGNTYGVYLHYSSNNNLINITASGNALHGVILVNSPNNNSLINITASGNDNGVVLSSSSNNSLSNIIASGNNKYGVVLSSSSNNSLSNITASGNFDNGVILDYSSSSNSLINITASGNGSGIRIRTSSNNNSLSNITASGNAQFGVTISSSSNNYFTGELQVGFNTVSACYVSAGTDSGLANGTCANQGSSDATLTTGVSVATSFVGPANDNYTLLSSDTVLRDVLTVPTGDYFFAHTWSDASTTTLLRNAVEIPDDGIGNDDGLCESDETCLYTPNIAAYQGHGELVSAGTFSAGTTAGSITGVTLLKYEANGY